MTKFLSFLLAMFMAFSAKAEDSNIIATVYTTVIDNHIESVNLENLAVSGLKGINEIDKNLVVADGVSSIYLYYKRKLVGTWKKPAVKNAIREWADISNSVIKKSVDLSAIAQTKDFMLVDVVLKNAVSSLDDNSSYRGSFDINEVEEKTRTRTFAERMMGDFLYIKLGNFNQHTTQNIKASLEQHKKAKGMILDLRGNKGGVLSSAIEVANLFIDEGIIVSTRGRENKNAKYYTADGTGAINLPLVIMIDGQTASAAEVLAGALQDQVQAKLVGTVSFGKASVQEVFSFENGGTLALTNAYFYTPSDKKINKIGLTPEYCTFKMQDSKSVDNLTAFSNLTCAKESRQGIEKDTDLAVLILQGKI